MGHNRMWKKESLRIVLSIFSIVLGEMLFPFGILAETERRDLSPPIGIINKYPLPPKIDGFELRSLENNHIARRAGSRFVVVLGGRAVLDKKTNLVWERSPDAKKRDWSSAVAYCATKAVGGRKGWRIPSFAELSSLMDSSNPNGNPDFPVGHPFENVKSYLSPRNVELAFYWLAKANANGPGGAWDVFANDGVVDSISEENNFLVWCMIGERRASP